MSTTAPNFPPHAAIDAVATSSDLQSSRASAAGRPSHEWTTLPGVGIDVHARAWTGQGTGTPIVLLHGLSLSSRYLIPLGRRLTALGHDVIAPDLPGFGRSRRDPRLRWPAGPNVTEQAEHLLAWMDARRIDRAVLFGNSVGVQVAVELAARHPDRVERLVLEGPPPDPQYRKAGKQYRRVMRNMPYEAPSLNAVYQVEYASAGIPRMVQQLRRTVDDPIEQRLPQVVAPTLVVRGRYDQVVSQQWAEEFAGLLPAGRLAVVEGGRTTRTTPRRTSPPASSTRSCPTAWRRPSAQTRTIWRRHPIPWRRGTRCQPRCMACWGT